MGTGTLSIICVLLGLIVALRGLFRPFLGLLVFLTIHFVQPGELIPALAPFRLELVYGVLLIAILIARRASLHDRSPLLSDPILVGAVLLIGAGLLSVPFAVWPGGAAETVIAMVKLIAVIFLMKLMVDTEARLRYLLWCMVAIGAWFASSSLSAYYSGNYYHLRYNLGDLDRAQGVNSIVGDPNELAGLLLALLPFAVALLRSTRNVFARAFLVACMVATLVAISLSGARIVMVSLVVMAIYYIFQSKRKVLNLVACVLIAALTWSWMPPQYRQRYLTVQAYAEGEQLDDSNQVRLQVWRVGGNLFLEHPIVGVGAGQFANAYGMIYLAGRNGDWMNPHNLLIQVACELGIVGLSVFVYFLWQVTRGIRIVLQAKGDPALQLSYQVASACSVMFLGVFSLSTVSHTLYRPYWYLLSGLVAANGEIAYRRLKAGKNTSAGLLLGAHKGLSANLSVRGERSPIPGKRKKKRKKNPTGAIGPSLRWHGSNGGHNGATEPRG